VHKDINLMKWELDEAEFRKWCQRVARHVSESRPNSLHPETVLHAELERRWQEMEDGDATGIPAENVFAELRRKYK
jgi:putative addiction module component (TIGR02574 family)